MEPGRGGTSSTQLDGAASRTRAKHKVFAWTVPQPYGGHCFGRDDPCKSVAGVGPPCWWARAPSPFPLSLKTPRHPALQPTIPAKGEGGGVMVEFIGGEEGVLYQ